VGVSRGCPKFESTRCYLRNGNTYELLILCAFSYNPSQQKPVNNFDNSSHGRSQGLSKLSRPCTCTAHRAVTFVIAWLSCYCLPLCVWTAMYIMFLRFELCKSNIFLYFERPSIFCVCVCLCSELQRCSMFLPRCFVVCCRPSRLTLSLVWLPR